MSGAAIEPTYRTFRIVTWSRDKDVLVEVATIGGREMLIATDLRARGDGSFDQAGYGFFTSINDIDAASVVAELRRRLEVPSPASPTVHIADDITEECETLCEVVGGGDTISTDGAKVTCPECRRRDPCKPRDPSTECERL